MRKQIQMVIADPNEGARAGLRVFLESAPELCVVGEADTGSKTLKLLEKYQPQVLLLEGQMPDMPSAELLERIAEHPGTRVLLFSQWVEKRAMGSMLNGNISGIISKHETVSLVKAVRAVAEGKLYLGLKSKKL